MKPYFQDEYCTLYHADCRDVLPTLEAGSVDLVLTDPPYGIGEARGRNKTRGKLATSRDYGNEAWDDKPPPGWLLQWILEKGQWAIVFGGNFFELPPANCWLVWDKDNGETDFADCELAWTNLKKAVRKFKWRWQGMLQERMADKDVRVHPTQKPVPVMSWCIRQAPGDCQTILDPFAGSGTTLVAAKLMGRKAIGIEIEERYCEIAAKRLAQGVLEFEESTP